jgi:hypothetical protein
MKIIPVFSYEAERSDAPAEMRWTLISMRSASYAGNDEPSEAHSMGNKAAKAGVPKPAGRVEAPEGIRVVSLESPILDIPGHGNVAIDMVTSKPGHASKAGCLLRWRTYRRNADGYGLRWRS